MSASSNRQSDYITQSRQNARKLWDAVNEFKALQKEWNALDYSSTLAEFIGENEGITALQVGSVVFDTANAIDALFSTGHATNIAKLL